jgi:hypothetical protein
VTGPLVVTLTGTGTGGILPYGDQYSGHGFKGTEASIKGGFNNIDKLVGGTNAGNVLTGMDADATWKLFDPTTFQFAYTSTNTLNFSGFNRLTGGAGQDTFDIWGLYTAVQLYGGAGDDRFVLDDYQDRTPDSPPTFTGVGLIDGVSGNDTMDWSRDFYPHGVYVYGAAEEGFSGQYSTGTDYRHYQDIDGVVGSPRGLGDPFGVDLLSVFLFLDQTWTVSPDGGTYSIGGQTLSFRGYENLYGGNAPNVFNITGDNAINIYGGFQSNRFVFADKARVDGLIDGGEGMVATIDWSAVTDPLGVTLTGTGTGTNPYYIAHGLKGTEASIGGGFDDIDEVIGGANSSNALTGMDSPAAWSLGDTDTYTSTNTLAFSGFGQLQGGKAQDTFGISGQQSVSLTGGGTTSFVFADGAGIAGTIDGGGGVSSLDYSAYTAVVRVNLAAGTATGTGGISRILNVTGGRGGSILVGDDQANVLTGGKGRNLIVGGQGADQLTAGPDGDLLIGGSTAYDLDPAALDAILAEWQRSDEDYETRVANLRDGVNDGQYKLVLGDTVLDDGAADLLRGGDGRDWYWANVVQDTIIDKAIDELVN